MRNKKFSSQFSVLSSQFSVLSSQFSVLSSQFSVLSSQFSVLSSKGLGVKLFVLAFIVSRFMGIHCYSQVGVGINSSGAAANASAILDVSSTVQGTLITRMNTTQRDAIVSPVESLLIYNTDTHCFEAYYNGGWVAFGCLASGCTVPTQPSAITGTGTVCQSQNGVTFSVINVSGVSYAWAYSGTGFTIGSGSGTNSISANFSATATSGTLSVTGSNACGSSTARTIAIGVNLLPIAPTAGTHTPGQTTITWNWTTVSGATAYYYNTVNTFSSATNNGGSTSYSQSGLTCGTPYNLYVWAYNSCGNSSPTTLTQSTSSCCSTSYTCTSGNIITIAGSGLQGYTGDGGSALCAELFYPAGIAFDATGNMYIAQYGNVAYPAVRMVNTSGIISTFAGGSSYCDACPANTSKVVPMGVAVNKTSGNVYIADNYQNRIRMVNTSGIITTLAGNGTQGYSGDGIPATTASVEMYFPYGIALDGSGNIYFGDWMNNCVRKITISTGIISTIAGNGSAGIAGGFGGDGGLANSINSKLHWPSGVAVDGSGNVYIADAANYRIRKITFSTGNISTVAGNGTLGFSGDGGAATNAALSFPYGVAVDGSGNMYIADQQNQRIRMVNTSGIISTIAGNGTGGYTGDGGPATNAELQMNPYATGIAVDASGNVYIGDGQNNRVRKVCK